MSEKKLHIQLNVDQQSIPLNPVYASEGADGYDIHTLYNQNHILSYDPSYNSTASCKSDITFINGEQGYLAYRGYTIQNLATHSSFLETAYLLYYGDLPNKTQLQNFENKVHQHMFLSEELITHIITSPRTSHPMATLGSCMALLSGLHHQQDKISDPLYQEECFINILGAMPLVVAAIRKHKMHETFRSTPIPGLSYVKNFLHALFAKPGEDFAPTNLMVKIFEQLFILHADHEQNASTSAVRSTASSGTNPYASIVSGIMTLWGPKHGGANEAVLNMLDEIQDISNISKYLEKAKDKSDPFLLMGFGHRVYKNFDPRAVIIENTAKAMFKEMNLINLVPRLNLATKLEKLALEDSYFVDRKLYPNVDFFSGIIYDALGIESTYFTPLFALARCAGWMAHWRETMHNKDLKIVRPRQIYTGLTERPYVSLPDRA